MYVAGKTETCIMLTLKSKIKTVNKQEFMFRDIT